MVAVLIDVLIAFWILAFGAMAIVPLVLGGTRRDQPVTANESTQSRETEDRVLSIMPVRPGLPSPIIDRIHARRATRPAPEQRRAA
jgi:hypothetical protein